MRTYEFITAVGMVGLLAAPGSFADAQPAIPGQQTSAAGPLVLEPIENGFVAAPDFKVTEFDNRAGALVGGYAGWLLDQSFLLGGAGYWLANGSDSRKLAYGGLLVGWLANGHGPVAFGLRGLAGVGQATLVNDYVVRFAGGRERSLSSGATTIRRIAFDEDFFIFEPQGTVVVRLTDAIKLDWSVGYRLVGGAEDLDNRLRGVTSSVAVRFGGR